MAIQLKSISACADTSPAERIMCLLADGAEMTSSQIKEALNIDIDVVCASLGWLEEKGRTERLGTARHPRYGSPVTIWRARRASPATKTPSVAGGHIPRAPSSIPLTERVLQALGEAQMTAREMAAVLGDVAPKQVSMSFGSLALRGRVERCDVMRSDKNQPMIVWRAARAARTSPTQVAQEARRA